MPTTKAKRPKAIQSQPVPKVFHIRLALPPEYRDPFEKFAKAHDRDMKKHGAHILKNAVEEWMQKQAVSQSETLVTA